MNAVVATRGIECLCPCGERAGRRGDIVDRGRVVDRHEHVNSLRAACLYGTGQPAVRKCLTYQMRDRDHGGEVIVSGWVEIEHHVRGSVDVVGQAQRRVVLDGALIGQPEQGPPIVAQRVVHLPFGGLRPYRNGLDPLRRVLRHVLLHEGRLPAQNPQHGEWPTRQPWQHPVCDSVQVVHQVALAGTGVRAQRLVQVGQFHSGAVVFGAHTRLPLAPVLTRASLRSSLAVVFGHSVTLFGRLTTEQ